MFYHAAIDTAGIATPIKTSIAVALRRVLDDFVAVIVVGAVDDTSTIIPNILKLALTSIGSVVGISCARHILTVRNTNPIHINVVLPAARETLAIKPREVCSTCACAHAACIADCIRQPRAVNRASEVARVPDIPWCAEAIIDSVVLGGKANVVANQYALLY
jgi:hypothetical protein